MLASECLKVGVIQDKTAAVDLARKFLVLSDCGNRRDLLNRQNPTERQETDAAHHCHPLQYFDDDNTERAQRLILPQSK
jgi:hypothetical protein